MSDSIQDVESTEVVEAVPEAPAVEPAPSIMVRQWVTMPGGSMDARMGTDLTDRAGKELKSAIGTPRIAVLATIDGSPDDQAERVRRSLVDSGFSVERMTFPQGDAALTLDAAQSVLSSLREMGITSGDGLVVMGDTGALSLASFVAKGWCGGLMLMEYPLDLRAAIEGSCTPVGFTVDGIPEMYTFPAATRFVYCDFDLMAPSFTSDDELYARALMVCGAVSDNEKAFGKLWDNLDAVLESDTKAHATVLADVFRSRGRVFSATSAVVRDSLGYGHTFRRALRPLFPEDVPTSTIYAEGLRFAARLAAGEGSLPVDDVLAIDDMLDALELGYIEEVPFSAEEMAQAIKHECFLRSNKFQMLVPKSYGRVRLSSLSDELLAEHTEAWVESRS